MTATMNGLSAASPLAQTNPGRTVRVVMAPLTGTRAPLLSTWKVFWAALVTA